MFKELFTINYNNKQFLILVDDNHRKTFLEVRNDGKLIYPQYDDFFELHKIYNLRDYSVVYDVSDRVHNYDEKVVKEKRVMSLLLAMHLFLMGLATHDIIDLKRISEYTYEQKYEMLNDIHNNEHITREDVIEVINNNPSFDDDMKRLAITQLDNFLILDPDINLRIYYENMKNLYYDSMPIEELQSKTKEKITGYYSSSKNYICVMDDADDFIILHELAHAGHNYCFKDGNGNRIDICEPEGSFLDEAMTNLMVSPSLPNYGYYYIEGQILEFFMDNTDKFDFHAYNEYGIKFLIDELKTKYPDVDIDYLIDYFDTNKTTTLHFGESIVLVNDEVVLDELFKITLSNIDENDIYSSFNSFNNLLYDSSLYDTLYGRCTTQRVSSLKEKYFNLYNQKLVELGYINENQIDLINRINSVVYLNGNFYISTDDYYLDYSGNKHKIDSNCIRLEFDIKYGELFAINVHKTSDLYSEYFVKSTLIDGKILGDKTREILSELEPEKLLEVMDALFDFYMSYDVYSFEDLQKNYELFDACVGRLKYYEITTESYPNEKEYYSYGERYYNRYVDEVVKQKYSTKKNMFFVNELYMFIEVDGFFYPCINNVMYPNSSYPIINDYNEFFDGDTWVIGSESITFKYLDSDFTIKEKSINNEIIHTHYVDEKGRRKLERYVGNNNIESLSQDYIKQLIEDNDVIDKNYYDFALKLADGTLISNIELDDSFFIEFGIDEKGNYTYQITRKGNVIFSSVDNFKSMTSKVPYKEFLSCIDYKRSYETMDEVLNQKNIKNALYALNHYIKELNIRYEYYDETIEVNDSKTNTISYETYKKMKTYVDFVEPVIVNVDGIDFCAKDIYAIYNFETGGIAIYFPDGSFYYFEKLSEEETHSFGYRYYNDLMYYIELYNIKPVDGKYTISKKDIIEMIGHDIEDEKTFLLENNKDNMIR